MKPIPLPSIALGTVLLLCSASSNARAADWPQWQGPQRTGISLETNLLATWPADGPKLAWKSTNLGLGYSTPSVVGRSIYLLENEGLTNENVVALSTADGKRLWTVRLGLVGNPNQQPPFPGSRSTPVVEGKRLFALGSDGDLACLETAGGKLIWKKSLRADFQGHPGIWAYSETPLIDGKALVCAPGGSNATIVALDKNSGALLWKQALPAGDDAAYGSPVLSQACDIRQYILFLQKGLVGVDAADGHLLWRYERTARNSPANIPTPLAYGDYVYSGTGRGGGGLIKLKSVDGKIQVEEISFSPQLPTSIGGAIKLGDFFYGTTAKGMVCAQSETGKIAWEDPSIGAASLCYADGRLYLHGENGQLALVEPSPTGYQEKARFTPPDQPDRGNSKAWTYPVIANGRLYIRDFGTLWCYDIARH